MRRLEFQAIFGFPRDERVELSEFLVAVHEGLRGDEAAGERDVHLAGIGLAPKLNSDFLQLALTESVFFIHEYRRHAREIRRRDWHCEGNAPNGISEWAIRASIAGGD